MPIGDQAAAASTGESALTAENTFHGGLRKKKFSGPMRVSKI